MRLLVFTLTAFVLCGSLTGCGRTGSGSSGDAVVLFSVTRDGSQDPQRLDMAMKLAGFCLDEKRKVVIFFNVKGVHVPAKKFSDDVRYGEGKSIREQLADLMKRGAEVHVCPVCMNALKVDEKDLIEGAQKTSKPKLFAHISGNTTVFTY